MLMNNKRGDLAVTLLVFLILATVLIAIFTFVTNPIKVKEKISSLGVIQDISSQESLVEFYVRQAGESAVILTYKEFASNGIYIADPVKINSNREIEFFNLNENLNEKFRLKFIENFQKEFEKYEFQEESLKTLKEIIKINNFYTAFDGNKIILDVNNLEFKESLKDVSVLYAPKINVVLNLNNIGLYDFKGVYDIKESCKIQEDIEGCFNNELVNFNAELQSKENPNKEKYILATLTSKKEFLIEYKFEKIEFSFVVR